MSATVLLPEATRTALLSVSRKGQVQNQAVVDGPPVPTALIARNDTPRQARGQALLTM